MKKLLSMPWFLAALLFLTGCPEVLLTDIGLVPGSVKDGQFKLTAKVEAKYQRETCEPEEEGGRVDRDCEPEPVAHYGHGLIGVWLPEGFGVDAARLVVPSDNEFEVLEALDYAAPALPKTFPYTPGRWWPFLTGCQEIVDGVTIFPFEFDISGAQAIEQLRVGVSVIPGYEDEKFDTVDSMLLEGFVDLTTGEVELRKHKGTKVPATEETTTKLRGCLAKVHPAEPGPRGCSCRATGAARVGFEHPLLQLLTVF